MSRSERLARMERKQKSHDRYVVRTYGLVAGQYGEILREQGNVCAICHKQPRRRYLAVDHDHHTGQVRGLLCYFCNTSLGAFEFDPGSARRASEYLARIADDFPPAPLSVGGVAPEADSARDQ